jgi:hypothetical protein
VDVADRKVTAKAPGAHPGPRRLHHSRTLRRPNGDRTSSEPRSSLQPPQPATRRPAVCTCGTSTVPTASCSTEDIGPVGVGHGRRIRAAPAQRPSCAPANAEATRARQWNIAGVDLKLRARTTRSSAHGGRCDCESPAHDTRGASRRCATARRVNRRMAARSMHEVCLRPRLREPGLERFVRAQRSQTGEADALVVDHHPRVGRSCCGRTGKGAVVPSRNAT